MKLIILALVSMSLASCAKYGWTNPDIEGAPKGARFNNPMNIPEFANDLERHIYVDKKEKE